MFTSSNGQGQETRVAADPRKVDGPINIDLLLNVLGAAKSASGGPPKNILEGAARIIDAADIGNNTGDALGTESPWGNPNTIYQCEGGCGGTYKYKNGKYIKAEGTPTETIPTHNP